MIKKAAKKRRISAEIARDEYAVVRLPDAEMMRLTGATRTTVAHWRTGKHPPPAVAVKLSAMRRSGDMEWFYGPQWRDIRLKMDGRLYLPGFRYGFSPDELATWAILVRQRDDFAHALERTKTALQHAKAEADYLRLIADINSQLAAYNQPSITT